MKRVLILLLFSFIFTTGNAHAVSYPEPLGFVNDFAKILSKDTKNNLNAELSKYEKETSIEIAVVTTPTLHGLTVEEYTIGLAKAWGVGKKGKDNGVILLVAPKERKVRIEVGYGLEGDLTDGASGRIIREVILPAFKAGKMEEGIVFGTSAVIKVLGNVTAAERAEKRRVALEKASEERIARENVIKNFLFGAVVAGFAACLVFFTLLTIFRALRNERLFSAKKNENENMLTDCENRLKDADANFQDVEQILATLKKKHPLNVWQDLEITVREYEKERSFVKETVRTLRENNKKSNRKNVEGYGVLARKLQEKCRGYATLFPRADKLLRDIEEAKKKSEKILPGLSGRLKAVEIFIFGNEDAKKDQEVRSALGVAMRRVTAAEDSRKTSLIVDWFTVLDLVENADKQITAAKEKAKEKIAEAKKARSEGPQLLKEMPRVISDAEKRIEKLKPPDAARKKLQEAREKYKQAELSSHGGVFDWVLIFGILVAARALIDSAESDALREKRQRDDTARSKARKSRSELYSSSSSDSSHSYSSSSSSDSFGGFGGGSFGGGGASGDW